MQLWHEPTDPLLAAFHEASLLTPEERDELWKRRQRETHRRAVMERFRSVLALTLFAGAVLSTTHAWAYASGVNAAETVDRQTTLRLLSTAEAALTVCTSTDERLHSLLSERASEVWRVEDGS